jgi:cytoskeleton protein RodZ
MAVLQAVASNDATLPGTPSAAGLGDLLRTAREKSGLSANDIAGKLRMGVKQVQALESGDYASLPSGTFLRGFVRNYAKLVSLNGEEAIALLEKSHHGASLVIATSQVEPARHNIKVQRPGGDMATPKARALATLLVVAALMGAAWYWWEFVRPAKPAALTSQNLPLQASASQTVTTPVVTSPVLVAAAPAAATMTEAPVDGTKSLPASMPVATTVSNTAIAAIPTSPPASTPAAPAAASNAATKPAATSKSSADVPALSPAKTITAPAGSSTLGFTFSGESWVEVTDAGGKILVSKRFKAGDAEEVFGRGPLSVVIGNAQATRMASNGREFDLVPHTRVSVARVTVK